MINKLKTRAQKREKLKKMTRTANWFRWAQLLLLKNKDAPIASKLKIKTA